jgi:hypothetical protein
LVVVYVAIPMILQLQKSCIATLLPDYKIFDLIKGYRFIAGWLLLAESTSSQKHDERRL